MLVDANILLYAVGPSAVRHAAARDWLETAVNGPRRVGLPWHASRGKLLRLRTVRQYQRVLMTRL
jgi:predicted nucleic acid-binding protein